MNGMILAFYLLCMSLNKEKKNETTFQTLMSSYKAPLKIRDEERVF